MRIPDPATPRKSDVDPRVARVAELLAEAFALLATPPEASSTPAEIYTKGPDLRGHTRRSLEDAIRGGWLVATKTSGRGYRIALGDLAAWEAARAANRPRRTRSTIEAPRPATDDAEAASIARLASVGGRPRRAAGGGR